MFKIFTNRIKSDNKSQHLTLCNADPKAMNPVIYFDELDKVSETFRGEEIIGILTDTSQNSQFHDKYFAEIDFDLSKCLFIFSYRRSRIRVCCPCIVSKKKYRSDVYAQEL